MIEQFVVPVDLSTDSGRALPVAAALADRSGASLTALVVVSERADVGFEEAAVRAFVADLGVRVDDVVVDRSADVAEAIAARTADPATLVCMASHGRPPYAELLAGSVADDVLARAVGPVMLVGPRAQEQTAQPEAADENREDGRRCGR